MKKEYRIWANKIKKADQPEKNGIYLQALEAGLDKDVFAREIALDLPKGGYHLNSGEVNSIVDMVWADYGMFASCEMTASLFRGLSVISADRNQKINGKLFHASFTHDLNKISIR